VSARPSGIPLRPAVSIVLPTYNRAPFLGEAFEAIRSQRFTDWELIVIDDGSDDGTPAVARPVVEALGPRGTYVWQENGGAYAARNAGLDRAAGRYVAFYDSDDRWLPHHLADCVEALESHADVDWVFSACRRVDQASGRVLQASTFYRDGGGGWPFLALEGRRDGRLFVIDDPRTTACMVAGGLNCGLQASVIRRGVFDTYRFQTRFRNEAEDQMAVIAALAAGRRFAYFDAVHVEYRVHGGNSSAAATSQDLAKRLAVVEAESRGYEELPGRGVRLSRLDRRALRRRLLNQYFWTIGYSLLWQAGRRRDALAMFHRGLAHWPWSLACWKTYALARARLVLGDHQPARD
jgi:glycosyltransferase involved in cell wall biosynthesis